MIHEALFYLMNYPGDLFKMENDEELIDSVDLQEFLHPGERKLLQRIMSIGLCYHQIQRFIKSIDQQYADPREINCYEKSEVEDGLYIKAFCEGVDEVLEDYRNKIINLEDTLTKNNQLTLTYILSSIEKYVLLLEALKSMIQLIKREKVHGCLLIGTLHTYVNCGVDSISNAATKIIRATNTMFYRHLCNWIIYGDLVDNYNEFFVCDSNSADENFLYSNQIKEFGTSQKQNSFDVLKKCKTNKSWIVRKFYLRKEMVPPNLSMETAETILFLGRIVWIMCNDPKSYSDDKFELKFKRDVWEGKSVEYYQKLQKLQNSPFNLSTFKNTIEDCRLTLTKYLWKVLVNEAKLLEHLQLLRDYYAVGRGELFLQFIVAAEDHLKETPTEYIITNLNYIFVETARKLYSENDKSYLRFELTLPQVQEKSNDDSNLWSRLQINFNVEWPLHILFHPKAMSFYNRLFCFLLRVKKTHIDLHKVWLNHTKGKLKIHPAVMMLRNNLMFIVNNLQYYLQVDVIESQFSILKNAIQNASEFEDIIRLHSMFLQNLLHKTFVMTTEEKSQLELKHMLYQIPSLKSEENSVVYKIILNILQVCDKFCLMVNMWNNELTELDHDEIAQLKSQSDSLIGTLLHILYSIHEKSSGHHLLQLLHHIDFNRWFSKNIVNLNLTQ